MTGCTILNTKKVRGGERIWKSGMWRCFSCRYTQRSTWGVCLGTMLEPYLNGFLFSLTDQEAGEWLCLHVQAKQEMGQSLFMALLFSLSTSPGLPGCYRERSGSAQDPIGGLKGTLCV